MNGRQQPTYLQYCPRCTGTTQFSAVYAGRVLSKGPYEQARSWLGAVECAVCQLLMVGIASNEGGFQNLGGMEIVGKDYPDVPDLIQSAASEAYRCLRVGALRGAVLLARAVIEATAKDQGIENGNLLKKIDQMHERHLVREYIKDGAHEVRHFGNDMAHGDFSVPTEQEDVELALELMDKVLDEVYQSPAQVARARARRAAADVAPAIP